MIKVWNDKGFRSWRSGFHCISKKERSVTLLLSLQAAPAPHQTHKKGVPVLPVKDDLKKSPSEYSS